MSVSRWLTLSALFFGATAWGQPARRPPSLEDLLAVRSVTGATLSPDGRFVAYLVRETDLGQDAYLTRLWLAPTEGGEPFPLTQPAKATFEPRWSPDSRWLGFLSSREGDKNQLFVISPVGGEAVRLTKSESAVTGFDWSPEGGRIAFLAEEPEPKAVTERKDRFGEYEVVRRDASFQQLSSFDVAEAFEAPVAGTPLTKGRDWSVQDFAWSPDGTAIAFSATATPELGQGATQDLFLLTLRDGVTRRLVSQPGPDRSPRFSPDGSLVAFVSAMGKARYYASNQRIAVVSVHGGAPRCLTEAFDENAELLAWGPTGIFFAALQRTASHLFHLDPVTLAIDRVSAPDGLAAGNFSLSADDRRVAFTAGSPSSLSEVFVSARTPFAPRRLTDLTAQVKDWMLGTRELIGWKSRDGTPIEGVLIKPADFEPGRKYPLLCIIHGGPTGIDRAMLLDTRYYPSDLWAARGALVLKVNYRGSAGYGEAFRQLNFRNLGVGDAWDVLSGVDELVAKGVVDPARVGCMGWSQGGYISAFLTTSSDRFAAISVGAAISDWATYYYNTDITPFTINYLGTDPSRDPEIYKKTSPMTQVANARTPTLIQHGENDKRVPIPNAYELRQGLEDRGVPVEMVVYKGFGHGITRPKAMRAVMQHNLDWFGHYLWGDPRPDWTSRELATPASEARPAAEREALRKEQELATAAHASKDHGAFLLHAERVAELAPRSTRALYNLACAQSLNGHPAEALALLNRLAELGVEFDLGADPDLGPLAESPGFVAVAGRMEALGAPLGDSEVAFTLKEKDLLTEGVAYDPKTGAFFVSSVRRRKVVRVTKDGRAADFVREGQDGLYAAVGLGVDAERRSLWVSTAAEPQIAGFRKEEEGRSFVFEYDLDSGRLRRKVGPPAGGYLSDLVVGPQGDLFVSDPFDGRLYVLRYDRQAFEVLIGKGAIASAQGLALSPDGRYLFAADYGQGIVRVDPRARTARLLEAPASALLTGIDGLAFAGDSLVGIQNGLRPHKLLRLRLDAALARIEEVSVLERGNPHFDEPTLGTLVDGDFYYVANSQYRLVGEDGSVQWDKLKNPVVLRARLPWLKPS